MLLRRHDTAGGRKIPAPAVEYEDNKPEDSKDPAYTKTDISRMNLDNLKSLAAELGIEVTEESTGSKLKAAIIEKLGL